MLGISKNTEIKKGINEDKGLVIAKPAALLFLLFEALNVVAYWFLYQYYSNVLLENSLSKVAQNEQLKTSTTHGVTNSIMSAVISNPFTPHLTPTFEKKANRFSVW
ncbi:hypothetical protein [Yeosuana sp.]|uniref:hypothetical protein n=1 Tax=Yeosuana sp. TaxID=2529388 RepID=UPI00405529D3